MTLQYLRILRLHVVRDLRRHPLLAALNVASIALGVAVYLAIQIATQSANRAFASTIDLVAGRAALQVTSPSGDLRDDIFPRLQKSEGISAATPLVRGLVTLPAFPGEYLQILGLDIFTDEPFRTFALTDFGSVNFDIEQWLHGPNVVAIAEEFAQRHGLRAGDNLRVQVNGRESELRVGFVLRGEGAAALDSHFAAMDIGWAQELLGRRGALDSVQLRLAEPRRRDKIAAAIRRELPPTATIAAPAQRSAQVENMLGGFELNLTAMSLVSLLVGVFLIYNTVSGSVVRRRREIGILRSLGTTRNEVRGLFLGEAILLGILGSALGCGLGIVLAHALVAPVSETISSLYVLVQVRNLSVASQTVALAFFLGLISAVVAAWLPARDAAQLAPVRALAPALLPDNSTRQPARWRWLAAASFLGAASASFLAVWTGPAWLGFAAAFLVLAAFSCLAPGITTAFGRRLARVAGHLPRPRLTTLELGFAAANLTRSLSRNAVTIAALAAAIAMTVAVNVMVFSFRHTVTAWVEQTLLADIFIGPASNEIAGLTSFMPDAAVQFLAHDPGVATVDTFREIELPFRDRTIALGVIRARARRQPEFVRGNAAAIRQRFAEEECVLVSESFANRFQVRDGDRLDLPTPTGLRAFVIAGTFYDYTRDQGVVYMSRENFVRWWQDARVHSVALYLRAGGSAQGVTDRFRAKFSHAGEFSIYSNRSLRTRIFEIFDQTFAVTYVLRSIAVVVAIAGIFLSLTTLVTERSRELAIFRAIGGSRAQLRGLLLWEAALVGLLAAMLGLASGFCLSLVLNDVINRAFFGWTIRLALPWNSLLQTPLWIVAAALAAALIPAWRASRLVLAEALRDE